MGLRERLANYAYKRWKESERMVEIGKAVRAGQHVFTEEQAREMLIQAIDEANPEFKWPPDLADAIIAEMKDAEGIEK